MITIKELLESNICLTPDGKHWEAALPEPSSSIRRRWVDALAVFHGKATAVRQTTKEDLENLQGVEI